MVPVPDAVSSPNASDPLRGLSTLTEKPSRRRWALHIAFGIVGIGAMTAMVISVGPSVLWSALARCAVFLPLLLAIEVARLSCEIVATMMLTPWVRRDVPLAKLIRASMVGYAVSAVMPAGRIAAEGTKAAMTARYLGGARAAAIATTNQSLALFSGAAIACTCALAAWLTLGPSGVAYGCLISAFMTTMACIGVQVAARARSIGGFLGRRFAKIRAATASFQDALGELPVFHAGAASVWYVQRLLQTLEFGILISAVGGGFGFASSFIAEGVNVAGGAAGDFIPGQLGATDGAFALAASSLHITVADAIAVAIVGHFLQLLFAAFCALTPLWWRDLPTAVAAPGAE